MNMIEYSLKALAFASMQATPKDDLIHAALGMTSDTGELLECVGNHTRFGHQLNITNLTEESGDVIWFINLAVCVLGQELHAVYAHAVEALTDAAPDMNSETAGFWLAIESARVADLVKGHTIYGRPLDQGALLAAAGAALVAVGKIAAANGITLEQILYANIAKLTTRYGAKFDQYRALNRDKDAEAAAIEQAVA